MFEKYDDIFDIFEKNLLDKIDFDKFEIKGSIQNIRTIIKQDLDVELPIIMKDDKELIYDGTINCLNKRREYLLSSNLYSSKLKTNFDINSIELKSLKMELDKKAMEYMSSKIELKKICEKYATAICIAIYNGIINKDLLECLLNFGYDGSYGNDNLKLMFELYAKNIENENRLNNLRKCNSVLVDKLNYVTNECDFYKAEVNEQKKYFKELKTELKKSNTLVEHYKNELSGSKTYSKKTNSNGFRIYGK